MNRPGNGFSAGLLCGLALVAAPRAFAVEDSGVPPKPVRQTGKTIGEGKTAPRIRLSEPRAGWTVSRMVTVAGEVSDPTVDPVTVSINGDRYLLRTREGAFKRAFPVSSGKNSVIVQAENRGGQGKAERTVFAQVTPVAMMLVLTSDTDGVYTDLHVYEPKPSAKDPYADTEKEHVHVYWASTNSPSGGRFYLNETPGSYDQPGYGPYLYTHSSPPLGIYRVDSNYWPSGDKAHTVGMLNVVLFAGTPQEQKRVIRQPLVMPGETTTLAWIKIERGQVAHVYAPSVDEKPRDAKVWPRWVIDRSPRQAKPSGGGAEE